MPRYLLLVLTIAACGEDGELPPGWENAEQLDVQQTQCDESSLDAEPVVTPTLDAGTLDVVYEHAYFRCSQEACLYHDDGDTTRFLTQPCDMHPDEVAKCSCAFDLSWSLGGQSAGLSIEVWRRGDAYAGPPDPPQRVFEGAVE